MVKETVAFLRHWISLDTKQSLRHDYYELAEVTLVFLDLSKNDKNVTVKAPVAIHTVMPVGCLSSKHFKNCT